MKKVILAPAEVAELLRVSPSTVRDPRWRKRVGLRQLKIGGSVRFLEEDLDSLINASARRGVEGEETVPNGETVAR